MPKVLLFDVNETLLDMRALDPFFEHLFGTFAAREQWFKELETLWLVTIATDKYKNFTTLAEAALQMTGEKEQVNLSSENRAELRNLVSTLPPHPDAAPALEGLKSAGLRLAALTNSTLELARAQLKHAALDEYLDEIFSADEVKRYKPAIEPYRMAGERLQLEPKEIRLVAAHAWDIAGAHAAGLKTAFVARPRKVLSPAGPEPDLKARDLSALAEKILHEDT